MLRELSGSSSSSNSSSSFGPHGNHHRNSAQYVTPPRQRGNHNRIGIGLSNSPPPLPVLFSVGINSTYNPNGMNDSSRNGSGDGETTMSNSNNSSGVPWNQNFPPLDPTNPEHARRIATRRRMIQYGKNTPGYLEYRISVPLEKRKPRCMEHPSTPDATADIPTRRFQGLISAWRRALHNYDPPELILNPTPSAPHPDKTKNNIDETRVFPSKAAETRKPHKHTKKQRSKQQQSRSRRHNATKAQRPRHSIPRSPPNHGSADHNHQLKYDDNDDNDDGKNNHREVPFQLSFHAKPYDYHAATANKNLAITTNNANTDHQPSSSKGYPSSLIEELEVQPWETQSFPTTSSHNSSSNNNNMYSKIHTPKQQTLLANNNHNTDSTAWDSSSSSSTSTNNNMIYPSASSLYMPSTVAPPLTLHGEEETQDHHQMQEENYYPKTILSTLYHLSSEFHDVAHEDQQQHHMNYSTSSPTTVNEATTALTPVQITPVPNTRDNVTSTSAIQAQSHEDPILPMPMPLSNQMEEAIMSHGMDNTFSHSFKNTTSYLWNQQHAANAANQIATNNSNNNTLSTATTTNNYWPSSSDPTTKPGHITGNVLGRSWGALDW